MITYRSSSVEGEQVAEEIKRKGRQSTAYKSDAASFDQSKEIVDSIVATYSRLDILVNNAGITKDGLLMRMSEADWDTVIGTNLKSVFNLSKAALRPMMGQRSGKI